MAKSKHKALARTLRKNQTDIEGLMWQYLSDRRLGGYKFRRQHPIGNYIVDFYCPKRKLAIELDGGQHDYPKQVDYDENRTTFLVRKGIKVLRYWDNEVLINTEGILDDILDKLDSRNEL
jgi:very-short-patch-repair endonuclease